MNKVSLEECTLGKRGRGAKDRTPGSSNNQRQAEDDELVEGMKKEKQESFLYFGSKKGSEEQCQMLQAGQVGKGCSTSAFLGKLC